LREAIACFRRALELSPESASLYSNLGLASLKAGRIEEAVSHLRKAIWLGAGSFDTHKNLARALMALPDPAGAEECYLAALRLKPDDAEAHYHLARAMLMSGKFEQGWLEYEWRFKWRDLPRRHLPRPRWSGEDLVGKRIVILAEEDPRDTIQLARYFDVLAEQGAKVAVECEAPLTKLLAGCRGVRKIVERGSRLPEHDFYIPLISLPATLATTLQTVPAARPYLGVATAEVEFWKRQLTPMAGVKVGLALEADSSAGGPSALAQRMMEHLTEARNAAFLELRHLEGGGGRDLITPQYPSVGQLESVPSDPNDAMIALAAVMRSLDLVIAVDNMFAHIAGAMGIPTWTILPIAPEPRWLLGRDDTPWYPTMRLFRQRYRNEWTDVAIAMTRELDRRSRQTSAKAADAEGIHFPC